MVAKFHDSMFAGKQNRWYASWNVAANGDVLKQSNPAIRFHKNHLPPFEMQVPYDAQYPKAEGINMAGACTRLAAGAPRSKSPARSSTSAFESKQVG